MDADGNPDSPGNGRLGWAAAALAVLVIGAVVVRALWPATNSPASPLPPGILAVEAGLVPRPGGPPVPIGKQAAWLVHLRPGEGSFGGVGGGGGGLLALSAIDPHLGCRVEWRPNLEKAGTKGFFLTPCHDETYTKAGVLVSGPSPRSLDTYQVSVQPNGRVWVDWGHLTPGDEENALRAVMHPR